MIVEGRILTFYSRKLICSNITWALTETMFICLHRMGGWFTIGETYSWKEGSCKISARIWSATLNELGLWLAQTNQAASLLCSQQKTEVCNQWYKHVGLLTSYGWNYCVDFVWQLGPIRCLVHSKRQIMSLSKFLMTSLFCWKISYIGIASGSDG